MRWRVEFLDEGVKQALGAFPEDIRASFERIVTLIESHGLERVREPYVKHLEGPVWEMRMKGRHCTRCVCDSDGSAGGGRSRFPKKDLENAAPGH
jgi:hypothetical protein